MERDERSTPKYIARSTTREEAFGDLAKGESPLVQPPRYRGETFEIPHAMDTPIGTEV